LAEQIEQIRKSLSPDDAPFGVNLIVRRSNERFEADLSEIVRSKVPLVITSLGAVREVVDAVHDYGGLVFHDVTNRMHAEKAAAAGVDGIIAVAAGAGGHAGSTSPFALLAEVRRVFDGAVVLGGAISSGADIAAARAMGADLAYMGTRFLATKESMASREHKEMILRGGAGDIAYTPAFSGVPASYLKASVRAAGLDPDNLALHSPGQAGVEAKPWRDIWSAGQGIAAIEDVPTVAELCSRLTSEFHEAISVLENNHFRGRPVLE
jgi:nitronate monooxygenase